MGDDLFRDRVAQLTGRARAMKKPGRKKRDGKLVLCPPGRFKRSLVNELEMPTLGSEGEGRTHLA